MLIGSDLTRSPVESASPATSRARDGRSNPIAGIALGAVFGLALWFGIALMLRTLLG